MFLVCGNAHRDDPMMTNIGLGKANSGPQTPRANHSTRSTSEPLAAIGAESAAAHTKSFVAASRWSFFQPSSFTLAEL